MDMNVYNTSVMNPDLGSMIWMGLGLPERSLILDDNTAVFNQSGLTGISAIDDLAHQTHAMDMNPMMNMMSDYHTMSTGTTSNINITPDMYNVTPSQQTQSLNNYNYNDDEDNNDDDDDEDDDYEEEEDYDDDDTNDNCGVISRNTISTQTQNNHNDRECYKKIEPIIRPDLVLKTPIAYQGNIDPSVIPIQKDGMAVCEKCGAIGVKHSFYTKERRFCSMSCARGFDTFLSKFKNRNIDVDLLSSSRPTNISSSSATTTSTYTTTDSGRSLSGGITNLEESNYRFKMSQQHNNTDSPMLYRDIIPQEELPQIPKSQRLLPSPCPQDDKIQTVRRKPSEFYNSYDWSIKLSHDNFNAAPVTCFNHSPGYDIWSNIGVGMKVEVENTDCDNQGIIAATPHSFWVGTVLQICGYKAHIRYEGFDKDNSHDFWVNLCSSEVHPVGWCATRGKPLIPPHTIENKYRDWKEFLVKRLSGARTLPSTFYNKINDSLKSRFRCGLNLEVVDKNRISQVKLATIHKIVGKRLYVRYFDSPPEDNGFWCHEDSPLIHPVGWATTVGHNLSAPQDYLDRMQGGHEQVIETLDDDATLDLFKMNFKFEEHYLEERSYGFIEGMKLEAIDPLNLSSICVATVMEVLKYGYMMIRIDSYDPDMTGADWFCYHEKSPCIFPVGFCSINNIVLTPPKGYDTESFSWELYLAENNCLPASENLFYNEIPKHGFKVGMKLECADLMDPRLVCVATISKVVGRLLKVHFDGWEDEYDQWLDCESPDMYPVGWCILVNHKLEGPFIKPKIQQIVKISPKARRKRKKKVKAELNIGQKSTGNILTNLKKGKEQQQLLQQQFKKMQEKNDDKMSMSVDKIQETTSLRQQQYYQHNHQRLKVEPKMEPLDVDIDTESVSSELTNTTSPSSVKSEMKFGSGDERHKSNSQSSPILQHQQQSLIQQQQPPLERKVTSYINHSSLSSKYIPRILEPNNSPDISVNELCPDTWNIFDVAQFLRVNDCTVHCDIFSRNKIDGNKFLMLTKEEIIELLGMKVGPSIKIYDLIQQLKCKTNPIQSRLMKANLNKKYL